MIGKVSRGIRGHPVSMLVALIAIVALFALVALAYMTGSFLGITTAGPSIGQQITNAAAVIGQPPGLVVVGLFGIGLLGMAAFAFRKQLALAHDHGDIRQYVGSYFAAGPNYMISSGLGATTRKRDYFKKEVAGTQKAEYQVFAGLNPLGMGIRLRI